MESCSWVCPSSKREFYRNNAILYFTVAILILLQERLFFLLLHYISTLTFTQTVLFIFLANSLVNVTLFFVFYMMLHVMIPFIKRNCNGGKLYKEAVLIEKYAWVVIVIYIIIIVVSSAIKTMMLAGVNITLYNVLVFMWKTFKLPHAPVEIYAYLLGSTATIYRNKKVIFGVHVLSYIVLLLAAYLEASIIFTS